MKKFESRSEITKIGIEDYRELKSTAYRLSLLPEAEFEEQEFSSDLRFARISDTPGIHAHNKFDVSIHIGDIPTVNHHTLSVNIACQGLGARVPELVYKRSINILVGHGVVIRAWQTTEIPEIVSPPAAQPIMDLDYSARSLFELHDRELKVGWMFGPTEARYLLAELDLIAKMDIQI